MSSSAPQHNIVPRRTFSLWLLLLVVAAGATVMTGLSALRGRVDELEHMAQWNAVGAAQETVDLLRIVLTPVLVSVAAVALYLALLGSRTIIERCSPPSGSWIVEGQEVKTGRPAVRTGWVMVALSLLLLSSSLYALHVAWAGLSRLLPG